MRLRNRDTGSAIILAMVITIIVIGISGAFISHSMIRAKSSTNILLEAQSVAAAEAGIAKEIQDLNRRLWNPGTAPIVAGYRYFSLPTDNTWFVRIWQEPLNANGIDDNGDGAIDETAEGNYLRVIVEGYAGGVVDWTNVSAPKYKGGIKRTVEAILTTAAGNVYWSAVFAGNSSNDPNFNLTFGGTSTTGGVDQINGDIYSGGGINVNAGAQLRNDAGTAGSVSGQVMYNPSYTYSDASSYANPNYVSGTQPPLDITSQNYATKASTDPSFVNVSATLNDPTKRTFGPITSGQSDMGNAYQTTNVNDPSHIFRLDPTNTTGVSTPRVQGYSGMNPDKHNYFLEDPTQSAAQGGTATTPWVTTANPGLRVNLQPSGNNKVYYIDGNLWVSNSPAYSFQWLNNSGSDMKVTIVVKGNIYLTDNLLYDRLKTNDAMALIAINDSSYQSVSAADISNPASPAYNAGGAATGTYQARTDAARDYNKLHGSGNIFFGDPGGGTTERFESFMYAQNNFYDNNIGASGTLQTNIYGNMTAGNEIQINRDISASTWRPLLVNFDNRIKNGTVSLPGLPGNPSTSAVSYKIASWRQIASKPLNDGTFNFTPQ